MILVGAAVLEQVNLAQRANLSAAAEEEPVAKIAMPPQACASFFVAAEPKRQPWEVQIDAMMIALKIGLPTLNGYSGQRPPNWPLRDPQDPGYESSVLDWATARGLLPTLCRLDVLSGEWSLVSDNLGLLCTASSCFPKVSFPATGPFVINLRADGNGDRFVDGRWSNAEPWGRWIAERQASLALALAEDRPVVVSVKMRGLLSDRAPRQAVWLDANGCRVASGDFDRSVGRSDLTLGGTVPSKCLQADRTLVLDITTDRAVTPASIGINADQRHLGVGVYEVDIRPAASP
jgi:hypothetical protein